MKREKFGVVWTMRAALVLVGLALAGTAWGDGREFSGFYRVSDVSVSGDTASLTLTLRLFNHSTADVLNETVMLCDWVITSRNLGTFPSGGVSVGRSVQR